MKTCLRVSPTTKDVMRCRDEGDEWKVHHRVLLLDTVDNFYYVCIAAENYVDNRTIIVCGFRTASYKSTAVEIAVHNTCAGVVRVRHVHNKYHCTMCVTFNTSQTCTNVMKKLEDMYVILFYLTLLI